MAQIITDNQHYANIADAIREKNGEATLYKPSEMASAIKGLSSLNFKVVGGTTKPSSPKENTIWINTSTTITGWTFSTDEPANPVNGMVWIITATNSSQSFNAIPENEIKIYLKNARQYRSGSWYDQPVQIYTNGKWEEIATYLFLKGNQYENITGGFELAKWKITAASSGGTTTGYSLSINEEYMRFKGTCTSSNIYYSCVLSTVKTVDLTYFNTITVKGSLSVNLEIPGYLRLFAENSKSEYWAYADANTTADFAQGTMSEMTLDVSSLSGSYYIGIGVHVVYGGEGIDFVIDEIILS